MAIRKPLELSPTSLKRVLKDARSRIGVENSARGITITVADKGVLVQIRPDKTRRELEKKIKQQVTITQTKFRLG